MEKHLTPRSAAKRAAMLDAAQVCFLEGGYANTSVDEVAARAGVSKATIYAHFNSKDDLFGAIICRRCDDQAEGMASLTLPDSDDVHTLLTQIGQRLLGLFLSPEVMGIYRTVIAESPRHPELAKAFYEAGPIRGKKRLSELFEQMRERELLSFDDTWHTVDMFVGMLRGECFHRVLMGLPDSPVITPASTVAAAVETMLKAFGRKD